MAADVLDILLKTNVAAGVAIVLVLALRKPARKAVGARTAYSLWLLPLMAAAASLLPARTIFAIQGSRGPSQLDLSAPAISLPPAPAASPDTTTALLALWMAGALVSLAVLVFTQRRFIRSLGRLEQDGAYFRAETLAIGPAVVGALRPRIVLPADFKARYDAAEQEVVLAHEAAHVAAGDGMVNALVALARSVCWFNPLIHIAARHLRMDQEFACDDAVLSAHPHQRRAYAGALLKTQLAGWPLPIGCYWQAGAQNLLKERIAMLAVQAPSRLRRYSGAAGVVALCLSGGFAAWAAQPATVTVRPTATRYPTPPSVKAKRLSTGTRTATRLAAVSQLSAPRSDQSVYERTIVNPIPDQLYTLRVTAPDGTEKTLSTRVPAGPLTGTEVTTTFLEAQRTYSAAKRDENSRAARGAPPQPLTPQLAAAFKTMIQFDREIRAERRARSAPEYVRLTVSAPPAGDGGPRRRLGISVPRNLTAEAKARALASTDAEIASADGQRRQMLIEARDMLAGRPTID